MGERLDTLDAVRAALAELRSTAPITTFARDVQIAPATLQKLLTWTQAELVAEFEGWMRGKTTAKDGKAPPPSPKAIAGRAESVGRIYGFLVSKARDPGIEIGEFASLFGLDPKVSQVGQGLKRGENWANDPFVTQDDPTLMRIVTGEGDRERNVVRAGILTWSPYSDEFGNPKPSFAGRIMTRLLGSLDPLNWGPPHLVSLRFHQILSADMLRNGDLDAIFSLYDLPSRRLAGFDFIHIPGLMAPLDAIAFYSAADVPHGLNWTHILDPANAVGIQTYVVSGDAGHLLVRGACGYPEDRVNPIAAIGDSADLVAVIAKQLVEQAQFYREARSHVLSGRDAPSPSPFVFIADADMANDVLSRFREQAARIPDLGSMAHEVKEEDRRPQYPIGIAVSANSKRWRDILEDTLIRELFVNAGPQTARQYAELLARPSKVCVGPLGDLIPRSARDRFTADVIRILEEMKESFTALPMPEMRIKAHIAKRITDIKKAWAQPAGNQ